MHATSLSHLSLLLLLAAAMSSGCRSIVPEGKLPWDREPETKVLPDRILAIWSDTVLHQPGHPGVRGFGGRLFFYSDTDTDPVQVDGGVMVYVFDADAYDPSNPQPLQRYAFTADQLAGLYSRAPLGHSYSVWLPWDEVGGEARSLSLVVKFEGREGGTVISDPVVKLLPGSNRARTSEGETIGSRSTNDSGVRRASFESSEIARSSAERTVPSRQVETIDLPPSFSRHLAVDPNDRTNGRSESRTIPLAPNESAAPTVESNDQPTGLPPSRPFATGTDGAATSFTDRPRAGSPAGSPHRRFPARTTPESPDGGTSIRRQPFPGGWLDGLPPTPRPSTRDLR